MKNKVQVLVAALVTLGLYQLYITSPVYACSCGAIGKPTEELRLSDAVFTGKVINIFPNPDGGPLKLKGENSVILEVATTWKGVSKSQVIVSRGLGGGPCEITASIGQSFLIYGNIGEDGTLLTGTCTRTTLLSEASDDLMVLGGGKPAIDKVDLASEYGNIEQRSTEESNTLITWALVIFTLLTFALVLLLAIRQRKRSEAD